MKREDGYYWIKIWRSWDNIAGWTVAQWCSGEWYTVGDRDELSEDEFLRIEQINETRLMPPK